MLTQQISLCTRQEFKPWRQKEKLVFVTAFEKQKSRLIGKDPDTWKDWRQKEKRVAEDEMVM